MPRKPKWRKGRYVQSEGYVMVRAPEHPRAHPGGYVFEHILVAERALGRFLAPPEEVHHIDEDKRNNNPSNLIVCPDRAYHWLVHQRTKAYEACGNAGWRKCCYCKQYDDPDHMTPSRNGSFYHRKCMNAHRRARYHRSKVSHA